VTTDWSGGGVGVEVEMDWYGMVLIVLCLKSFVYCVLVL